MRRRYICFWMAVGLLLSPLCLHAQDAATKAKLGNVRTAYAKAQQLYENGKKATKKNSQRFESVSTDPNGTWTRTVEFVFDNSEHFEELDIYPCELVMVRQRINQDAYQEFLFDKDGDVQFIFLRQESKDEGVASESRYYFEKGVPFWKMEKTVDLKTNKVRKEESSYLSSEIDDGSWLFYLRVAADLKSGFQFLNAIYD